MSAAVDMLALEQARAYLAGRYGEHDGWAGSIRDAIAAIQSAEAALLAKSAAYDALVARIEAAPVVTAGSWIRNYMASANRIEYGTRVRLLVSDDRPSHTAGENRE